MSKTILAQVNGWTPVIDSVARETSVMAALVFGRIWRFCQMKDGVCTASLADIATDAGISRTTVYENAQMLVDKGYLEDLTPTLRNAPHMYKDTGKAGLYMGVSTVRQENSSESEVFAECTATVRQVVTNCSPIGHEESIKKVLEEKEQKSSLSQILGIESAIRQGRPVTQEDLEVSKNAWPFRDKVPEQLVSLLDAFVRVSGMKPTKGALMDWIATAGEWTEIGITPADIVAAYGASQGTGKDAGFHVGRPGSLTGIANSYAGKRHTQSQPVSVADKMDAIFNKGRR